MPPATEASKSRSTPASLAASQSSPPWLASSSLLAETTGFPLRKARSTRSRVGEMPPMTSTTTSIEGSSTTPPASVVRSGSTPGTSRSLVAERTATLASSSWRPVRSAIRLASLRRKRARAAPTLPQPSRPTRTVGLAEEGCKWVASSGSLGSRLGLCGLAWREAGAAVPAVGGACGRRRDVAPAVGPFSSGKRW